MSHATGSLHVETPLVESRPLSRLTGKTVRLKMEALQPSGSFKLRGVGFACEEHAARGARRFVSSSGGNAGIAVAYAGRRLRVPVTVVVPESTSDHAKALIRNEDAELVVHGASWHEANEHARSLLGATDAFIHPFDDPLLWSGHASMVDEIARSRDIVPGGRRPGAVVLSVGGGGLLCGVVQGLRRNGWGTVPVIAAGTEGADAFAQSVAAGHRVTLPAITSIATSLGARQVCEQAFLLAADHPVSSAVVTDRDAVRACGRFLDDHRILVEPACGASLALLYDRNPVLDHVDSLVVIVCGGATATVQKIVDWSAQEP